MTKIGPMMSYDWYNEWDTNMTTIEHRLSVMKQRSNMIKDLLLYNNSIIDIESETNNSD